MRIAQVVVSYPPYRGGLGQVAYEYTTRLRARHHEVEVFTSRCGTDAASADEVHRIRSPLCFGQAALLPSLPFRLSGFDLVHLHYPFFGGAEPVALRRLFCPRMRLVMTYHMDPTAGGLRGAVFRAHRSGVLRWMVRRVDRILVSTAGYAAASPLGDLPEALDKMEVHPFGVDAERFHPGTDQAPLGTLGISEGEIVLLFVGGLDSAHCFKGLEVLLAALAGLEHRAWRCVVVGDGDMQDGFRRDAETAGIAERVHFFGRASDDELPRAYQSADLFVFPSTTRAEAFGLVALEAAASGLPVIASDLPGVRSVVLDGETGVLVPPGDADRLRDALGWLLADREARERLGSRGRARAVSSFSWDAAISRLEAAYERTLSGPR